MKKSLLGRHNPVALGIVLAFFLLSLLCRAEGIVTITFEGPPIQPPNSAYAITNYGEGGTVFAGFFGRRNSSGSTNWPDNGSTYIQTTAPPVNCSRSDGLSFQVISVDLAGFSVVIPDCPASFQGQRNDGSVVTTNFPVSGLSFQTYYFPPEFADLTNLVVTAGALDNFTLQLPTVRPVLSMGIYYYRGDSWLTLQAQGTLGLRYRLEYTDGFPVTNWVTLTTFESSFSQVQHVSKDVPRQRFFRAVELP